MVAFLSALICQLIILDIYADQAVLTKTQCTHPECCADCQIQRWEIVDLGECQEAPRILRTWVAHECSSNNEYSYREFDNSWCAGKAEFVRTSGRCYPPEVAGKYYFYQCHRYSMVDPGVVPSLIERDLDATPSKTYNNGKEAHSAYISAAFVTLIVYIAGIFIGYVIYKQRHRKNNLHLKLQEKEIIHKPLSDL